MRLIDAANAKEYLRGAGRADPHEPVEISRLAGGVSNEVLYIGFPADRGRDFVLKQAREQLRVADPWFCSVDRIWREVEVLRICQRLLADRDDLSVKTPRILFEDRENYCFGMQAAPRDHVVWKRRLLEGEADRDIAQQCGRLLGAIHAGSWQNAEIQRQLADRQVFDELRLDPYYRTLARRHPEAAPLLKRLVDSVWQHQLCLVHADFSPKNLLVYSTGLMMVDFETGHWGDPAFDLGFFLSHLALKAFHHAPRHEPFLDLTDQFWQAYGSALAGTVSSDAYRSLIARAILNFAGCAWARLDGKSPVEYLDEPIRREQMRTLCRQILECEPTAWSDVLSLCRRAIESDIGT